MIIQQLNKVSCDRVIKSNDIDYLLSIEERARQLELRAEQMMAQVELDVEEIKHQAYQETTTRLLESNQQLLTELEQGVSDFLDSIHQELHDVILRVLVKLGFERFSSATLCDLLKSELGRFKHIDKVTLVAHPEALQILKQELARFSESCEFKADLNMSKLECICTTHYWSLHLDINTVITKLTNLLTKSE